MKSLLTSVSARTLAFGGLSIAGILSSPAWAVNFGCLLGSRTCSTGPVEPEPKICKVCLYSEVNYAGTQTCVDANAGWISQLYTPPTKSIRFHNQDCRVNRDLYVVQGVTATSGALKIVKGSVPNLAAVAPGWSRFTWATYAAPGLHPERARSIETVLPTFPSNEQYGFIMKRNNFLLYPFSNPQAAPGVALPSEGSVVAYSTSDMAGGCLPVGNRSDMQYLIPPKTALSCSGVLLKIVPNATMTCSFRTASGSSTVTATPAVPGNLITSLQGAPQFGVSVNPTVQRIAGTLSSNYSEGVLAWAYYTNQGPNAVAVECKP